MEMKRLKPSYDPGTNTIMIDSISSLDDYLMEYDKIDFDKKIDSFYDIIKNKTIPPLKDLNYWDNDYKFPYEKKGYYDSVSDDEGWNKQMEQVREIVEKLAELEKRKNAGKMFPIRLPEGGLSANPRRQMTAGENAVVEHAVNRFNASIPRDGVPIDWSPAPLDKGTLWRLNWKGGILTASVTVNGANTLPPIRMNGVRRIKKSEEVLSELVIERLYILNDRGDEITLFSIV